MTIIDIIVHINVIGCIAIVIIHTNTIIAMVSQRPIDTRSTTTSHHRRALAVVSHNPTSTTFVIVLVIVLATMLATMLVTVRVTVRAIVHAYRGVHDEHSRNVLARLGRRFLEDLWSACIVAPRRRRTHLAAKPRLSRQSDGTTHITMVARWQPSRRFPRARRHASFASRRILPQYRPCRVE